MSKNKNASAFIKSIITLLGVILVFRSNIKAEAAVFTHVHTPSCYTQVTKICTNHDLENEYGSMEKHCWNCGCMRDMHVSIWWDVCRSGLVGSRDVSYTITCNTCGTPWRQDGPPSTSSHTYTGTDITCGMTESTTAATLSLYLADGAPTNGEVTVCADVSVSDPTFSLSGAPFNFGGGYSGDSSVKVSDNGVVSVSVMSADGREISGSINVTNIDKTAPVIASIDKSTTDWTEAGVTITVNAGDGESGLAGAAYSFNGSAFGPDNTYTATSNGTVSVRVMDAAGNITDGSISINNIGRDPEIVRREEEEAARKKAEEEARVKAEAEAKRQAEIQAENARKEAALKEAAQKEALQKEAAKKADAKKETGTQTKAAATDAEKTLKDAKLLAKGLLDKTGSVKSDISANEVSGNNVDDKDVSPGDFYDFNGKGGKIKITDLREKESVNEPVDMTESLAERFEDSVNEEGKNIDGIPLKTASAGGFLYKAGPFILALGLFFFSFFNYIYATNEGNKRIVALARIRYEKERTVVCIKKGAIKEHGRYVIFYSLISRIRLRKKKPVYVQIGDSECFIKADEGIAFKY